MSERESVTKPLKEALEALGCLVLRLPTGGQRGRIRLLPRGTPDLLVFPPLFPVPWRVAVCETKASHRDTCRCDSCAAQRRVRGELERRQVLYVFARSVEQGLVALGLLPPLRAA